MIQAFATDKGMNCPAIAQVVIVLLMYADDVILVARTQEEANKLMRVLEDFCELSGLHININKIKTMLRKTRGKRINIQT